MWWIKASIQEYSLRSWSLVKMGTTANQKKLFFNLRKAKSKISILDERDMRPEQVKTIARLLGRRLDCDHGRTDHRHSRTTRGFRLMTASCRARP